MRNSFELVKEHSSNNLQILHGHKAANATFDVYNLENVALALGLLSVRSNEICCRAQQHGVLFLLQL
jgi:hypothetical protein